MPKKLGSKNTKPYGKGAPAKPGYTYRARPKALNARNRSDGRGTRYPIKVLLNDDLEVAVLNQHGRPIDRRMGVVKAAKAILTPLIQELGGPAAITHRQKLQLEIIVRRAVISRGLFASTVDGSTKINPQVGVDSDKVLLTALDRVYR